MLLKVDKEIEKDLAQKIAELREKTQTTAVDAWSNIAKALHAQVSFTSIICTDEKTSCVVTGCIQVGVQTNKNAFQ